MHMKLKSHSDALIGAHVTQADSFFSLFFGNTKRTHYYRNLAQFYPAKTVVVKQDTPANAVYLIEQGMVKLVRETANGRKVIIGLRHRDWLIGAPTVLLGCPYHFTVIAVLPTLLRGVPKQEFLDHIARSGEFSMHVHHLLSTQVLDQMRKMEDLSCLSVEQRLVCMLARTVRELEQAGLDSSDRATIPLSNQELAQLLMITPEHLCRVLKGLEQNGLVGREKGTLVVTDRRQLLQAADI